MAALPSDVIIPEPELTTEQRLYSSRTTRYRWEVLTHDPATGREALAGFLDGVTAGSVKWSSNTAVKGSGSVTVADLDVAQPGYLTCSQVNLVNARIRPVLVIDGLPEIPLSVYVITAAPETWATTGRSCTLELHDKATRLDQDAVTETFTAPTDAPILTIIRQVIESAGERIDVDPTVTDTLANARVYEVGTTKLAIVNDLLDTLGWNSLWVDGQGAFRVTPYIRPAARPITYDILNGLPRELVDGEQGIYTPNWTRDLDSFGVPNQVTATASGSADAEPLTGIWQNTDPGSPYSYPSRGFWITTALTNVEVPDGTDQQKIAALNNRAWQTGLAMSSPQAKVTVKHLPLPLRTSDVLRFRSIPAGIDARHVVTSISLDCQPTGLMTTELQEVIDL